MRHYKDQADIFKVCGRRTPAKAFLMRTIDAYREEKYAGNLLDLLDVSHWMAARWELRNEELPEDFIHRLAACDQHCQGLLDLPGNVPALGPATAFSLAGFLPPGPGPLKDPARLELNGMPLV